MQASVADPVRAIARGIGSLWWLWLAVAFVVLQFDRASITTVGVLLGAMFLAAGAQQFVIAMFAAGVARWILIGFGVLMLVAAVISFVEPEATFAGVADILGFWTAGQFFIEKAHVLLVFAGIWAIFHGTTDIIKAFQIRRVAKLLEEVR